MSLFATTAFASKCPVCGHLCDCAANASGIRAPRDGDLSLCILCGSFSLFKKGALVAPTQTEMAEIATHPGCMRVRRAWEMGVRGKPQ